MDHSASKIPVSYLLSILNGSISIFSLLHWLYQNGSFGLWTDLGEPWESYAGSDTFVWRTARDVSYLVASGRSRSIATRSKLMFHLDAQMVAQLRVSQLHHLHPRSCAKGEQPSVKDRKSYKWFCKAYSFPKDKLSKRAKQSKQSGILKAICKKRPCRYTLGRGNTGALWTFAALTTSRLRRSMRFLIDSDSLRTKLTLMSDLWILIYHKPCGHWLGSEWTDCASLPSFCSSYQSQGVSTYWDADFHTLERD